jgi:sulfur carrier protein
MSGEDRIAADALQVAVNGEPVETRARTLAALLIELGYGGRKIATARNGDFVPERHRAETLIAAGDAIEVVAPRQGG